MSEARVEEFLAWQRAERALPLAFVVASGLEVPARRAAWARGAGGGGACGGELADGCAAGGFERYLLAERGLAAGTVVLYLASARRFVDGLPPDRGLAGLAAGDVTAAVLRESEVVSVSAAQNFVSGLRSFLRFCFVEGLVGSDLSRAALLVRGRSSSPLPRGISRADARALLGSCDRRAGARAA